VRFDASKWRYPYPKIKKAAQVNVNANHNPALKCQRSISKYFMANFFSIPDQEKNYQSYMVFALCILWTVVAGIVCASGFIMRPLIWDRWLTFILEALFIAFTTLTLNRMGYTRTAAWTFIIMLWLYQTVPTYTAGGIQAPGILAQTSVILTAGFLVGWRGGLAIGLLSIGTDFWLAYMEVHGQLPVPTVRHSPTTRWVATIIPFATIVALQYYATNHLRSGLIALQREIAKREEAEKKTNQTVYNLEERVKELKTLYAVSHILQDEDASVKNLLSEIAELLPAGWQHPDIAAARVFFSGTEYATSNYKPSAYSQLAEAVTDSGSVLGIEVVYLQKAPESYEGPFLKEERNLIDAIAEMVKMNLDRRARRDELKDYKYALDIGYMVSISDADKHFTYVNGNFCKASKHSPAELLGQNFGIILSGAHPPEYLNALSRALQQGQPISGEFCNKAKDGTLYWVDTTIVPFLDDDGKVYRYLSINHDITARKEADQQIKQSERLLKKITSQIPGNTFMFEIDETGNNKILFMSRGKDAFNHSPEFGELLKDPENLREIVHDDDKAKFNNAMLEAFKTQSAVSIQYRVQLNGDTRWRWLQAVPENDKNGKVLWYGAANDITPLVDYLTSIEQIIFDIGHVIRRPVSSMLGMTQLIMDGALSDAEIKEVSQKLHTISEEMDTFILELNYVYNQKRQDTRHHFDISSLIDKRSSLFK
jgi:PAS domain S-box-containing protein